MSEQSLGINDSVPFGKGAFFSLQHICTMIGATVTVPLIISPALEFSPQQTVQFISGVMFCMGLATLAQTLIGSGLPIVQGSSFAYIAVMLFIASEHKGYEGLAYICAGALVCGIFQFVLGATKIIGKLRAAFTKTVIGCIMISIGLSLFQVGGQFSSSHWFVSCITMMTILGCMFMPGGLRSFSILIGTIIGICAAWSMDLLEGNYTKIVQESSWIIVPFYGNWNLPEIDFSYIWFYGLLFILASVVSTVESVCDYGATVRVAPKDNKDYDSVVKRATILKWIFPVPIKLGVNREDREDYIRSPEFQETINKGIRAEGIGNLIVWIFGGVPTTSYGENIAVMEVTRIAARRVVIGSGFILCLASCTPLLSALPIGLPKAVIGGLYCVVFGTLIGIGIRLLADDIYQDCYLSKKNVRKIIDVKNETEELSEAKGFSRVPIIAGISIFLGLAIPSAFSSEEIILMRPFQWLGLG